MSHNVVTYDVTVSCMMSNYVVTYDVSVLWAESHLQRPLWRQCELCVELQLAGRRSRTTRGRELTRHNTVTSSTHTQSVRSLPAGH